jgi:hypothetical protein
MGLRHIAATAAAALVGAVGVSGTTASAQTGPSFSYSPTEGPVGTTITITNGGCTSVQEGGDAIALYRSLDGALVDVEVQLGNDAANRRPWATSLTVEPEVLTPSGVTEPTTPGNYQLALFCDIGSSFRPPDDPDFPTSPGEANLVRPFVVTSAGPPDTDDIAHIVAALPSDDFRHRVLQPLMVLRLELIGRTLDRGFENGARLQILLLRRTVDGCGSVPDRNDWIIDCSSQVAVRGALDGLIASI